MKYRFSPSQHTSAALVFATLLIMLAAGCGSGTQSAPPPPPSPTLVSIQITPQTSAILLGENQQFTATGKFNDGSTQDVTKSATWTSSNTTAAVVNGRKGWNGFAAGVGSGSSSITASQAGVRGSANISVSVPAPRLAYGPNQWSRIFGYSVDPSTGLLTALPEAPVGACASFIVSFVLDPAGSFAFVNSRSWIAQRWDCTAGLVVDAESGRLDAVDFWYHDLPGKMQLDPARRFVFEKWGSYSGVLSSVRIDSTTGKRLGMVDTDLSSLSSSSCHDLGNWIVERGGKFILFVCSDSPEILSYRVDAQGGAPSGSPAISPISEITTPAQMLIEATGQFMYFVELNRVTVYSINYETGGVTKAGVYATSGLPIATISPNGRFFYATHWTSKAGISAFSIDPMTGTLQELPWSPLLISADPFSLVIDPSGKYLYVQSGDLNGRSGTVVSIFTIDPIVGTLIKVADQSFSDSVGIGPGPLNFAY